MIDTGRVVAFTDGVFAIAATLLVLSISVPQSAEGLGRALLDESDSLFAYALSFAILANFWIDHHKLFGNLRAVDGAQVWLNMLYLALIAIMPFSCELIGTHGDTAVGVSIYAANMVAVPVVFGLQCRLAIGRGEVAGGSPAIAEIDDTAAGGFVLAGVFAASIPLAVLVSPEVATWAYLSLFIVLPMAARVRRRLRTPRTS